MFLMLAGLGFLAFFGADDEGRGTGQRADLLRKTAQHNPSLVEDYVLLAMDFCVPEIRRSQEFDPDTVRLAAKALTVMMASEQDKNQTRQAMIEQINAATGNAGLDSLDPRLQKVNLLARRHLQEPTRLVCIFDRAASSLGA